MFLFPNIRRKKTHGEVNNGEVNPIQRKNKA